MLSAPNILLLIWYFHVAIFPNIAVFLQVTELLSYIYTSFTLPLSNINVYVSFYVAFRN